MSDLGERIRKLRINRGLTLQDIGEHFRIHRSSVSDWENDKTLPDARRLVELSSLLNTSVEYLLTGNEDAAWPFRDIELHRIKKLSEAQRSELSIAIRAALAMIEARVQDDTDSTFPARGGVRTGTHKK